MTTAKISHRPLTNEEQNELVRIAEFIAVGFADFDEEVENLATAFDIDTDTIAKILDYLVSSEA
ncbi:hypothetical protein SEA_PSONYX_120 [Corynebacterium phage PSonyx]|nr:hypothetical protein SEA_PSONYX_120 [Corynebacterium phage PSonyx]